SDSDRVKAAAIVGLGRLGRTELAEHLLEVPVPSSFQAPLLGSEGPHATPNSDILLPHLAVKALVALNAEDAVVNALGTKQEDLALWAMRYMHSPKVVEGLIKAYGETEIPAFREKVSNTLARLYHKEAPYDTSWWWSTRPDTHGPYYKTVEWEMTPVIGTFLTQEWKNTSEERKDLYAELNSKYRLGIEEFGILEKREPKEDMPLVDLDKIKNKKGQVGEASIEDVMIAINQIKGDPVKGKEIYGNQGCFACHSISTSEVMKGPFMGQIGSIMNREQIAESILKPNASISQGFSTVKIETNDGSIHVGFVTAESATDLTIRNIAGIATELKKEDIASREELPTSMMPAGLVNSLSYEEFASLLAFLEEQK
ncbi:MAG: c-type cytochrome, partial [Arenibacter sp.]|nr:c-type cytochrome [Arenibacter sp.]